MSHLGRLNPCWFAPCGAGGVEPFLLVLQFGGETDSMTFSASRLAAKITEESGRRTTSDAVLRMVSVGLLPRRTRGWGRGSAFTPADVERAAMFATLRAKGWSLQRIRKQFGGIDEG